MDSKDFINLLDNVEQINDDTYMEINRVLKDYPYFQAGYMLLIKSLQNEQQQHTPAQLNQSAVYVKDRKVLFEMLQKKLPALRNVSSVHASQVAAEMEQKLQQENFDPQQHAKQIREDLQRTRVETVVTETTTTKVTEYVVEEKETVNENVVENKQQENTTTTETLVEQKEKQQTEVVVENKQQEQTETNEFEQLAEIAAQQSQQERDEVEHTDKEDEVEHGVVSQLTAVVEDSNDDEYTTEQTWTRNTDEVDFDELSRIAAEQSHSERSEVEQTDKDDDVEHGVVSHLSSAIIEDRDKDDDDDQQIIVESKETVSEQQTSSSGELSLADMLMQQIAGLKKETVQVLDNKKEETITTTEQVSNSIVEETHTTTTEVNDVVDDFEELSRVAREHSQRERAIVDDTPDDDDEVKVVKTTIVEEVNTTLDSFDDFEELSRVAREHSQRERAIVDDTPDDDDEVKVVKTTTIVETQTETTIVEEQETIKQTVVDSELAIKETVTGLMIKQMEVLKEKSEKEKSEEPENTLVEEQTTPSINEVDNVETGSTIDLSETLRQENDANTTFEITEQGEVFTKTVEKEEPQEESLADKLIRQIAERSKKTTETTVTTTTTTTVTIVNEANNNTNNDDDMPTNKELIDKFIETNPQMPPPNTKSPAKDLSSKSVELSDEFITENLAKIYVQQERYQLAISVYEKLMVKYPDKKAYFESEITRVKNLPPPSNENNEE